MLSIHGTNRGLISELVFQSGSAWMRRVTAEVYPSTERGNIMPGYQPRVCSGFITAHILKFLQKNIRL